MHVCACACICIARHHPHTCVACMPPTHVADASKAVVGAKSGAAAPKMGTIFAKDVDKQWKRHTPGWAHEVPNHFV